VYIGKVSLGKTSAIETEYVLALATLGGTTQVRSFLFVSNCQRKPMQVQSHVAVAGVIALNLANGNTI
jgi:hypothetical protein